MVSWWEQNHRLPESLYKCYRVYRDVTSNSKHRADRKHRKHKNTKNWFSKRIGRKCRPI